MLLIQSKRWGKTTGLSPFGKINKRLLDVSWIKGREELRSLRKLWICFVPMLIRCSRTPASFQPLGETEEKKDFIADYLVAIATFEGVFWSVLVCICNVALFIYFVQERTVWIWGGKNGFPARARSLFHYAFDPMHLKKKKKKNVGQRSSLRRLLGQIR